MGGYLSSSRVVGEVGVFTVWSRQSSNKIRIIMDLLIRLCYAEGERRLYLVLFFFNKMLKIFYDTILCLFDSDFSVFASVMMIIKDWK